MTAPHDQGRTSLPSGACVDYKLLAQQIRELARDERLWLPTLANMCAVLWEALPGINWCGFYLVDAKRGDKEDMCAVPELVLGPFQGKLACVRIPFGTGVCGTAAAHDCVQLVANVHEFSGHIACDAASKSEIVLPIHKDYEVIGVLDIDAPEYGRFGKTDREGLLGCVKALEESCATATLPLS
ncbi:MAG: GAF domain-containing protein [Atopobiaceae bacterium]